MSTWKNDPKAGLIIQRSNFAHNPEALMRALGIPYLSLEEMMEIRREVEGNPNLQMVWVEA